MCGVKIKILQKPHQICNKIRIVLFKYVWNLICVTGIRKAELCSLLRLCLMLKRVSIQMKKNPKQSGNINYNNRLILEFSPWTMFDLTRLKKSPQTKVWLMKTVEVYGPQWGFPPTVVNMMVKVTLNNCRRGFGSCFHIEKALSIEATDVHSYYNWNWSTIWPVLLCTTKKGNGCR